MSIEAPKPPEHMKIDPNRPADLPLDEIHEQLEKAVEKLKIPRVKHPARSAWNHLKKAWVLHPIDSEMSLFRAITAEEEAATALIRALQEQRYPNAKLLNSQAHPHKAAIWPFIIAFADKLTERNIPLPHVALRVEGSPRIELSMDIGGPSGLHTPLWGTPDEPFNWSMWSDYTGKMKPHDFSVELAALASRNGAKSISAYISEEANKRNRILYASDEGIPAIFFADSLLLGKRQRVTVLLTLTIAVMQTRKHQMGFVQCLDALLRAIDRFSGEAVEIAPVDTDAEHISMTEQPDGSMRAALITPHAKT